jgi:hypothetical protein
MPSSDYTNPSSGTQGSSKPTSGVLPHEVEETLRSDAQDVVETAKSEFDKVAQEATAQASDLAEQAKAQLADVTHKAKGLAAEQKDLLAGQIGGVADAMERVATDLESSDASSAHYARMIADGATKLSDTVRNNDVDAILNMAQDFGRKQPAAFIGAAALLGFAASRFLLASGKREEQRVAERQMGTSVDYNGTLEVGSEQSAYGSTGGSDYPSEGRL